MAILKNIAKRIWFSRVEPRLLAAPLTVQLTHDALHSIESGVATDGDNSGEHGEEMLIVSITTHGKRIYEVYLAIESILRQTLKPNKIILWLGKNEFNENNIPSILKKQQRRGLEIKFCDNIRSYKKLVPALQAYPQATIITIDDDIIYPFDLVENLYRAHLENPNMVCGLRCHKITFCRGGGQLKKYNKWLIDVQQEITGLDIFPTGAGGVLSPSGCFHSDVTRSDIFTTLAPVADDVWFKAMTLLRGVPCRKVVSGTKALPLYNNQDIALEHINVAKRQNDVQIKQVFEHYNIPLSHEGINQFKQS
jgi:hypothetical protein